MRDISRSTVVAGHKNKNRPDDRAVLSETRQYLQDVIRLLDDKPTAREFYEADAVLGQGSTFKERRSP